MSEKIESIYLQDLNIEHAIFITKLLSALGKNVSGERYQLGAGKIIHGPSQRDGDILIETDVMVIGEYDNIQHHTPVTFMRRHRFRLYEKDTYTHLDGIFKQLEVWAHSETGQILWDRTLSLQFDFDGPSHEYRMYHTMMIIDACMIQTKHG